MDKIGLMELLQVKKLDKTDVRMLNPLKLAYVGDAVYEVYIRQYLINSIHNSPSEMSKKAIKYVKASAQAELVRGLQPYFTEEEWTIIKRGRNQKSNTVPKNAILSDYKYATGFETLIGFLYLVGQEDRIIEIIAEGILYLENVNQASKTAISSEVKDEE